MTYAQIISGQPVALTTDIIVGDLLLPLATLEQWSDDERADIGVYQIVDDAIPEGKVATGSTLENDDGVIRRRWALEDAPPPPVPQSITPAQAKATLFDAGLLDAAETLVAEHPYPLVRIYWTSALQFERSNAYINGIAFELGISDEQLDTMFTAAALRDF